MTTNYRIWNSGISLLFAMLLGSIILANYIIDPYYVFHSNYTRVSPTVNDRFNKIEYLKNHHTKYNSFLIGSSRMGTFDNRYLENLYPNRKYYNLSFFAAEPEEILSNLIFLKNNGARFDYILMGIDIYPFIQHQHSDSLSVRPHPLITKESHFMWYKDYFVTAGLAQLFTAIENHVSENPLLFDFSATGSWLLFQDVKPIENTKYYHPISRKFDVNRINIEWDKSKFVALSNLIKWINANTLTADFFIHPFHNSLTSRIDPQSLDMFYHNVRTIVPNINDFSGLEEIVHNNYMYYDEKHYRPMIADSLIARIFQTTSSL